MVRTGSSRETLANALRRKAHELAPDPQLIIRHGISLAAGGMLLGLLASLAATRFLTSMLFEVKPGDPAIYLAVACLLALVVWAQPMFPRGAQRNWTRWLRCGKNDAGRGA